MDVRPSIIGLIFAMASFVWGAIGEAGTVPNRLLTTEGTASSSPAQGSALQSPATAAPTAPTTGTAARQPAATPQLTTGTVLLSTAPLSTGSAVAGDFFQCLVANVGSTPGNVTIQIVDATGAIAGQSDVSLNPGEVKHSKIDVPIQQQQHYCQFVVRDNADSAAFRGSACIQDSFGRCIAALPAQ